MRNLFVLVFVAVMATVFSCKSPDKKNANPLLGKWDLILWNNQQSVTPGTFVFTDSVIYFNMDNITEISNYKMMGDTLVANRVGGRTIYLAGYDYWVINKVDSVFFKMTSSNGNIVTAYKEKKYWGIKDRDSAAIRL